jgi:MGT family glycosyltransferase
MARAAFFSFPGHGHVNPTLPLVAELVRRGETVDYHCTEDFRGAIAATGARFQVLSGGLERLTALDPKQGMFMLGEVVAEATLNLLPRLIDLLGSDPPDYVLHDSMAPWGRLVARKLGLPAVATYPTFGALPEASPLPPLPLLLLFHGPQNLARNLGHLRRRRSLTRETAMRFGVDDLSFANLVTNPAACNIVFTSERFQMRRAELGDSFHFVGATLSEPPDPTFPLGQIEGRRVVYVSLGTVFNEDARFFRACLEAFGSGDDVVVIAAGKRLDIASLGTLPANSIVRPHVPQLEVLRRSALCICHGGMNTVMGALHHGVPLLIRPQGADNFLNARRVQELGLGRSLGTRDLQPARLRRLGEALMSDVALRARVREIGDSLRTAGGAQRAADIVIRFREQGTATPAAVATRSAPRAPAHS